MLVVGALQVSVALPVETGGVGVGGGADPDPDPEEPEPVLPEPEEDTGADAEELEPPPQPDSMRATTVRPQIAFKYLRDTSPPCQRCGGVAGTAASEAPGQPRSIKQNMCQ